LQNHGTLIKIRLYLFDLAGYGNVPLRMEKGNVFLIAGWSDKIFEVLQGIENGQNNIAQIDNIVI
jgi:60 kDa SS-A/Ro ribonucleoprotein